MLASWPACAAVLVLAAAGFCWGTCGWPGGGALVGTPSALRRDGNLAAAPLTMLVSGLLGGG